MDKALYRLLLADDDPDDRIFFADALKELPFAATLSTVNDGVQLMDHLADASPDLPDLVFLDLNMPRKSGIECLSDIKQNDLYKDLPVIIFSSSFNPGIVDLLYQKGAMRYIRKPGDYDQLKKAILEAVSSLENISTHPSRDQFIIQP